jgi:hypothetical protein
MGLQFGTGLGGSGLILSGVKLGGSGLAGVVAGGVPAVDSWVQKDFQNNPETISGGFRVGVFWKDDGLRVWTVRDSSNRCDQHDVSPAWSIVPGTWTNRVSDITNFGDPRAVWLPPDGTKIIYLTGSGVLFQFPLSTPFDLSTIGAQTNKFIGSGHQDMYFSVDGLTVWVYQSSTNTLKEFAMTIAFDVTTLNVIPVATFVLTADISLINSFRFSANGKILYAIGQPSSGTLVQWTLTTAFDITTAGSFVQGIAVTQVAIPRGLTRRETDGCLFVFGDQGAGQQKVKVFGPP